MTHRIPETPTPPERPKGTPAPTVEPDPEWEEMQAMMDRIVREPMDFEPADVAVTAGHMNAAHAEGPITLHDGIDTKPPEARVIIGDAVLPTKVLSREPLTVTGLPRKSGRTMLVLASGLAAVLIVGAIVLALVRRNGNHPPAPQAGASPPSSMAAKRTTGPLEIVPSLAPPSPGAASVAASEVAPPASSSVSGVVSAAPAAPASSTPPASTPPGNTNVGKTSSRPMHGPPSTTTTPSPVPNVHSAPAISPRPPEQAGRPEWRSPRSF